MSKVHNDDVDRVEAAAPIPVGGKLTGKNPAKRDSRVRKPKQTEEKGRKCEVCGIPLSRYNRTPKGKPHLCWTHKQGKMPRTRGATKGTAPPISREDLDKIIGFNPDDSSRD